MLIITLDIFILRFPFWMFSRLTISVCLSRGFNRDAVLGRAKLKNKIGHVGPRRCGQDRYDDHGREGGECGDGGHAVLEGIRLSN
jgi:hypothetical protein